MDKEKSLLDLALLEERKKEVLERAFGGDKYERRERLPNGIKEEFFIQSESGSVYQFKPDGTGRRFSSKDSGEDQNFKYLAVFPAEPDFAKEFMIGHSYRIFFRPDEYRKGQIDSLYVRQKGLPHTGNFLTVSEPDDPEIRFGICWSCFKEKLQKLLGWAFKRE